MNSIEELPEKYLAAAIEELANDFDLLYSAINESVWGNDYLSYLFDNNNSFRDEVIQKRDIESRAIQLFQQDNCNDD